MFNILTYKALGDLVIAVTSIERVPIEQRDNIRLVFGSHLSDLVSAIAPKMQVDSLSVGESHVPSLFDVKKRGIAKAVRSAFVMRRSMQSRFKHSTDLAILDRSGSREKLIANGLRWSALPTAANIYLAYVELLNEAGFAISAPNHQKPANPKTVGIFAGSRIAAKNIPSDAIDKIESAVGTASLSSHLFLLDGERQDLEESGRPYTSIPKSFASLISAIKSVDIVISADSLPAHLAERIGTPVFVVSPRANPYWLPLSSFEFHRHSLFTEAAEDGRLRQFLSSSN
jgi:hypothetical protein